MIEYIADDDRSHGILNDLLIDWKNNGAIILKSLMYKQHN